jgi:hypothetical protein
MSDQSMSSSSGPGPSPERRSPSDPSPPDPSPSVRAVRVARGKMVRRGSKLRIGFVDDDDDDDDEDDDNEDVFAVMDAKCRVEDLDVCIVRISARIFDALNIILYRQEGLVMGMVFPPTHCQEFVRATVQLLSVERQSRPTIV